MADKLTHDEITAALATLPGWTYDGEKSISKEFTYPDHITAFGFLTRVAMAAERMDHHPQVEMVYNKVKLTLWTHTHDGITTRDIKLAEQIETYA